MIKIMKSMENWRKISCPKGQLQLEPTLTGGQSFRWKKSEGDTWTGIFKERVWILSQSEDSLLYQCYKPMTESSKQVPEVKRRKTENDDDDITLANYFRLDVDLKKCYETWGKADPYFKESAKSFYGIRMLQQEVFENLFSFICSSNNNIARISSMVEKLCALYGTEIVKINDINYYSFPEIERLCSPKVEEELRKAGFGYRAKFIHQSACMIEKLGSDKWLGDLKKLPYLEAKRELMKLPGIGAKVADCICLMSLSHLEAIPVDTHIFQVASKIYLPHLKGCKSLTEKVYNEISLHFQNLYGEKAGWAHTVRSIHFQTVSSILLLLYGYLSVLQDWTSTPDMRQNVLEYKWFVISFTFVDFGFGSLLAYAANLIKRYRRPKVIVWLVFDGFLLPVNIYLLRNMNHELENSKPLSTDIHLHRVILVHEIYEAIHLIFIVGAINFLAYYKPKQKKYDPTARPDSVFGPTDPQITTTESRRIRFSESFLQTNTQKSSDVEASSSTRNQTQLRATISAKFGLYRMNMLPLITAYWVKQFTTSFKPGKNSRRELKRAKALARFHLTYPDFYNVLVNIRNNRRSKRLKTTKPVPLEVVSSSN